MLQIRFFPDSRLSETMAPHLTRVLGLKEVSSVLAWQAYRQQAPSTLPAGSNHDVNLDIGETVHVEAWAPDGTGAVKYRGAQWQVALMPGAAPLPGSYVIVEVVGNRLVVRKV